MEVSIFPKLGDFMDRYVEVRLDTDPTNPSAESIKVYQKKLTGESQTRPVYVVVESDAPEKPIESYVGADLSDGSKNFAAFLRRNVKP